jgi:hypothetical protein
VPPRHRNELYQTNRKAQFSSFKPEAPGLVRVRFRCMRGSRDPAPRAISASPIGTTWTTAIAGFAIAADRADQRRMFWDGAANVGESMEGHDASARQ